MRVPAAPGNMPTPSKWGNCLIFLRCVFEDRHSFALLDMCRFAARCGVPQAPFCTPAPRLLFAKYRSRTGFQSVFAKVRTCAGLLHDRGFAVSKATAEKSESKTQSVFVREKPLPSFPTENLLQGKYKFFPSVRVGVLPGGAAARFVFQVRPIFAKQKSRLVGINLVATMADMRRRFARSKIYGE